MQKIVSERARERCFAHMSVHRSKNHKGFEGLCKVPGYSQEVTLSGFKQQSTDGIKHIT